MELDEVKTLWAQAVRKLDASMRLNTLLLQRSNLRKAETSLKRLSAGVTFELVANVLAVVVLGAFAADHVGEPRFFFAAVLVDVYAVALVVVAARTLAAIHALDYDEPVVALTRKVQALRLLRIRTTLATLLFAPLMWLPIAIVALRALFGVDLYEAGWAWLAGNALFGLAVIPVAVFVAKRYGERLSSRASIRALADTIAGRSLSEALESLDSIRRFAEDDYSVSTG